MLGEAISRDAAEVVENRGSADSIGVATSIDRFFSVAKLCSTCGFPDSFEFQGAAAATGCLAAVDKRAG
jgi:hypothetical protein